MNPTPMDFHEKLRNAAKLVEIGDFTSAVSLLNPLLKDLPGNAQVHWLAGRIYGAMGRLTEAANHYRWAQAFEPLRDEVSFKYADGMLVLKDVQGSIAPANILGEIARGMYKLDSRVFRDGATVIDVGAHIGGFCIPLAKLHPHITIYAFEASPKTFKYLCDNIKRNDVQNIVPVNKAVAGNAGELEFFWARHDTTSATFASNVEHKQWLLSVGCERTLIPAITLDDIFQTHSLDSCALLKLDCEGAEYGIFENAQSLRLVDAVALELHIPMSYIDGGGTKEAFTAQFLRLLDRLDKTPSVDISSTLFVRHR